MRPVLSPLIAIAMVAALPGLASAERLKVAIVPGIPVNLDAARVDTLSQELADALRSELDIDTVGGLEVRRQLPAAGLPADCVASQPCITDVARRLSAHQLLFVVMVDTGTGGAVQVDTTWVDVPSGRTASRPAIDIAALASAKAQFASAARQLLPDAPVLAKPEGGLGGRMSDPVPRHLSLASYLTAGVTVVGIGVGVAAGFDARKRYRDCDAQRIAGMACSPSRKDAIRSRALIADAGWAVALAGTIATAVLYATSAEPPRVIVEPISGGAAATWVGSF